MTTTQRRRPWWVGPGVGAVLGTAVIAVAAQGSLAAGHVVLPAGPHLRPTTVRMAAPAGVAPAQGGTVVAPVRPVVTQSSDSGSSGSASSPGQVSGGSSGSDTASSGSTGGAVESTAPAVTQGATAGPGPVGSDATEGSATPSTNGPPKPQTTTTTTTSAREPGDT